MGYRGMIDLARSLPARGVWIEIRCIGTRIRAGVRRRSPQGECGLKYRSTPRQRHRPRRSPQGECGLKYEIVVHDTIGEAVAPRKGSVD